MPKEMVTGWGILFVCRIMAKFLLFFVVAFIRRRNFTIIIGRSQPSYPPCCTYCVYSSCVWRGKNLRVWRSTGPLRRHKGMSGVHRSWSGSWLEDKRKKVPSLARGVDTGGRGRSYGWQGAVAPPPPPRKFPCPGAPKKCCLLRKAPSAPGYILPTPLPIMTTNIIKYKNGFKKILYPFDVLLYRCYISAALYVISLGYPSGGKD